MKNPCHKDQISSIRRIEGQIRGIEKMIENGEYCIDILNQLKAVQKALASVEANILETHVEHCVAQAISSPDDAKQKIAELTKIIKR